MQIPRRKSEELKKRDDGPLYITEDGFRRLKEKLARLKNSLPNLITEPQRAAAYGDRSENAEYQDAKSKLRNANRQILVTEDQIKRSAIIKSDSGVSGSVRLGSTVVLEANGSRKQFQIVGPHETDPANGRISYQSPLGSALMNRKNGETVTISTENGAAKYKILEIK